MPCNFFQTLNSFYKNIAKFLIRFLKTFGVVKPKSCTGLTKDEAEKGD